MILTFIYPLKSFGSEGDKGDRKEGSVGTGRTTFRNCQGEEAQHILQLASLGPWFVNIRRKLVKNGTFPTQ